MRGDKGVIAHLNQVLANELIAINQYFLHARMFKNWGLAGLDDKEYHKSIKDMKHADGLIERILFLEGLPNLQDLGKLHIGENCAEILRCELEMQMRQIPDIRAAIAICESSSDYISRELLERILDDEEEYVDWLETQVGLIDQLGLANYLQSYMEDD